MLHVALTVDVARNENVAEKRRRETRERERDARSRFIAAFALASQVLKAARAPRARARTFWRQFRAAFERTASLSFSRPGERNEERLLSQFPAELQRFQVFRVGPGRAL